MLNSLLEIEKKKLEQLYQRITKCAHAQRFTIIVNLWEFIHRSLVFRPLIDNAIGNINQLEANAHNYYNYGYHTNLPEDPAHHFQQIYYIIKIKIRDNRTPTYWDLARKFTRP